MTSARETKFGYASLIFIVSGVHDHCDVINAAEPAVAVSDVISRMSSSLRTSHRTDAHGMIL